MFTESYLENINWIVFVLFRMQSGLKDYAEFVTDRNKTSEFIQVVDPRTDEEKIHAADLIEIGIQTAKKNMRKYEPGKTKVLNDVITCQLCKHKTPFIKKSHIP